MYWRDIGFLVAEKQELDSFNKPYSDYKERLIYCNKKRVRQSEFWQAHTAGQKPEVVFEIRSSEYKGEKRFKYADVVYRIIRAGEKDSEIMEIVCSRAVNVNVE